MIQLQDFYREAKGRYGLRLLTGTAGLTHEFTWVHLCEDIGNVSFLRGGELVITTGLSALREHWLEDFLADGADAAETIIFDGLATAQERFNGR